VRRLLDRLREHRDKLRYAPFAVAGLVLLFLLARNYDTPALPDYEVPEGFTPSPPPAPDVAGGALPVLASVDGTTTTVVPPNVGRARLSGSVTGPQGPVPGAVVRLERIVGDVTQTTDVLSGADGRFDAPGIGGGRYRVRAFLVPSLAQPTGEVFFLTDGEERVVDLTVEEFAEPTVAIAVAPDPLLLDQPLNLAVRVSGRLVDADGVVRTQPLVGGTVQVTATGGWTAPSPSVTTTDANGEARFSARCRSTDATQLQITVRLPAALPGDVPTVATFDVDACVDPATLTTTTTSTTPDQSSTSTSVVAEESTTSSSTTSTTAPG
jgi:hypothetical protein